MEEPDFSGYATKASLKCSDGRTIMPEAFQHMDGQRVPLVWRHSHEDLTNVLGYADLEARPDGVYAYGYFNDSEKGRQARALVEHGDVDSLSIYANNLVERSKQVFHGVIRELSLVLSGANPGAKIENVRIAHGDGFDDVSVLDDEAIIYSGEALEHSDIYEDEDDEDPEEESNMVHGDEPTIQDIYNTLNSEQRTVVEFMIGAALEEAGSGSDISHAEATDDMTVAEVYENFTQAQKDVVHFMIGAALEEAGSSAKHSAFFSQEGHDMSRNVFASDAGAINTPTLSHDALQSIVEDAKKNGSFKEAFLEHAERYGIENIDMLFPDAKTITSQPELIARRTEWVKEVIDGAKHSPFSRIKSLAADLTADEARAKGYVKGNLKKDEVIKLLKRVTTPTTIYKKQKLDRDDIVDITDLDVVAWLKWEMRFMLEEELARAILIGDGREPDDEDKIDEEKLRPIAWDHEMYSHPVTVPANISPDGIIESVLRARKHYKGTGVPTFYTTDDVLTDLMLIKDKIGRRQYNTEGELAAALRVSRIVVVEVMEDTPDLLGIIVNMADYTVGADKGGALSMFDDFDIDYNQFKYLMETRISGALTKPKSAVVVKRTSGTTVTPLTPTFDEDTNTLTIPTVQGVEYFNVTDPTSETKLASGDSVISKTTDVEARPMVGYSFPHNTDADWTFAYTGA